MTAQEVYNQLPNDFLEVTIIGIDYAKKNEDNKYSKLLMKQMFCDMGTEYEIEIKKTVARLISSVMNPE